MANKHVDLSLLMSYIDSTLESTDKVRKMLQAECDEANFVLRPWIINSVITRDIDENYCTCVSEVNVNERAEEIAIGIDKTLAQAQQLRQKVAKNIAEDNNENQTKNDEKSYITTSTSETKLRDTRKKKLSHSSVNSLSTTKKCRASKNFIAANKSNVRAISQRNIEFINKQKLKENNKKMLNKKHISLVTDLDSLIKKVSLNVTKNETLLKSDCPCHGDNVKKTVTECKRTIINMVDGLEEFGVPDNLLAILKIYHSYMAECAKESKSVNDRPAIVKFLNNLEAANEKFFTTSQPNDMAILIHEFPKLYQDLNNTNLNSNSFTKLKAKYHKLNDLSKKCGIKKYNILNDKRSDVNLNLNIDYISRGWLSNGIWNWTSLQYFSQFTQSLCIQYTNKNELLSLFNTCQRLQLAIYRNNLLDLLLYEIIPMMKKELDPTTKEYVEMYKMIFVIAQVLNPKIPVLVKTEE